MLANLKKFRQSVLRVSSSQELTGRTGRIGRTGWSQSDLDLWPSATKNVISLGRGESKLTVLQLCRLEAVHNICKCQYTFSSATLWHEFALFYFNLKSLPQYRGRWQMMWKYYQLFHVKYNNQVLYNFRKYKNTKVYGYSYQSYNIKVDVGSQS